MIPPRIFFTEHQFYRSKLRLKRIFLIWNRFFIEENCNCFKPSSTVFMSIHNAFEWKTFSKMSPPPCMRGTVHAYDSHSHVLGYLPRAIGEHDQRPHYLCIAFLDLRLQRRLNGSSVLNILFKFISHFCRPGDSSKGPAIQRIFYSPRCACQRR